MEKGGRTAIALNNFRQKIIDRRNDPTQQALFALRKRIQGRALKNYEIRVISGHRSGPDIYSGSHLNDHAAVRRAMSLVRPHQWIEVWCGARCVYAGSPGPVIQPNTVPVWEQARAP